MPPVVIEALILQSFETGNSSQIIRTLTPEYGALSVMAKGLMRKGKEEAISILQPLNVVELSLSMSGQSDLAILRDQKLIEDFPSLRKKLSRYSLGCLIADMVVTGTESHQDARELYRTLLSLLEDLDQSVWEENPMQITAGVLRILMLQGYDPQIMPSVLAPWPEGSPKPKWFLFDLAEGAIQLPDRQATQDIDWPYFPARHDQLMTIPSSAVRLIYELQREKMPNLTMSEKEAIQIIGCFARFFQWHHDTELKSLKFWHNLVCIKK